MTISVEDKKVEVEKIEGVLKMNSDDTWTLHFNFKSLPFALGYPQEDKAIWLLIPKT